MGLLRGTLTRKLRSLAWFWLKPEGTFYWYLAVCRFHAMHLSWMVGGSDETAMTLCLAEVDSRHTPVIQYGHM